MKNRLFSRFLAIFSFAFTTLFSFYPVSGQGSWDIIQKSAPSFPSCTNTAKEIIYNFDLCGTDSSVVIENISAAFFINETVTMPSFFEYLFWAPNTNIPCSVLPSVTDSGRVKISFKDSSGPISVKNVSFFIKNGQGAVKVRVFRGASGSSFSGAPATGGVRYSYNSSNSIDYITIACAYNASFDPFTDLTPLYGITDLHVLTNLPANNTPNDIALNPAVVDEGPDPGAYNGTLETTDPDDPSHTGLYTYSFCSGTGDADNGLFTLSGNVLTNLEKFDYETKPVYHIRVQTTDNMCASFQKPLTITINYVSANSPPTDISLLPGNINENMPCGSVVGALSTTDPDAGDTHTYSLVTGTGSTDNDKFSISGNSLIAGVIFNYESVTSYSVRIRSTDGGGNSFEKQFTVNINDITTEATPEVVLLIDQSGSMSTDFYYQYTTDPNKVKLTLIKNSLAGMINVLNDLRPQSVSLGLARFPNYPQTGCNAESLKPVSLLTDTYYTDLMSFINTSLVASGSTPMMAGINTARDMFGSGSRKVIVLLTDGVHNCPSWSISTGEINSCADNLRTSGISMYTIGFGTPDYVPNNMLYSLATGTCGIHYDITALKTNSYDPDTPSPAAVWNAATALDAAFATIAVNGLGMSSTIDPLDIISRGETKQYSVPVTDLDDMICFYVSWVKPQLNYLGLKLKTPGGAYLPLASQGVKVTNYPNHTIVTLNQEILEQPGMSGEWKLEVYGSGVTDSTENYQYMVINSSDRLKLNTWLDCKKYYAGDKIKIFLELLYKGERVTGIDKITAGGSGPGISLGNWLTAKPITIAQLNDAKKKIVDEQEVWIKELPIYKKLSKEAGEKFMAIQKRQYMSGLDPVTVRSWVLRKDFKLIYPARIIISGLLFYDDGTNGDQSSGDGIYTAEYKPVKEGTYHFYFTAAESRDGRNLQRENQIEVYVNSGIKLKRFIREIKLTNEIVAGAKVYDAILSLADQYGNIPLPTVLDDIKVTLDNGRPMGKIIDNMDGTFTQRIAVPQNIKPGKITMSLSYGTFSGKERLASGGKLWIYGIGILLVLIGGALGLRKKK